MEHNCSNLEITEATTQHYFRSDVSAGNQTSLSFFVKDTFVWKLTPVHLYDKCCHIEGTVFLLMSKLYVSTVNVIMKLPQKYIIIR
jgi:hypothetical protein